MLRSVSQNPQYELSETTLGMFTIRGVPYGQKVTRSEKNVKHFSKKKKLNQGEKWNKKMGGRSFFVTSGAFTHGLLSPLCLKVYGGSTVAKDESPSHKSMFHSTIPES